MGQSYRIIVSVNDYEICDILNLTEEDAAAFWNHSFEVAVEDWLNSNLETMMLNYSETGALGTMVFTIPIPQVTEEMDAAVDQANRRDKWLLKG